MQGKLYWEDYCIEILDAGSVSATDDVNLMRVARRYFSIPAIVRLAIPIGYKLDLSLYGYN